MDTKELAWKAQKGDHEAFGLLMENRKEAIYRVAYSYVKNREDALDIVSEAVYKAFVSVRKLKNPDYFNTWFTRILINCAINHLNKNKKLASFHHTVEGETGGGVSREEKIDLYSAIDSLDAGEKTIIILMYLEGFTLREIAELLECPLGTVKTRLNKALISLRVKLQEV